MRGHEGIGLSKPLHPFEDNNSVGLVQLWSPPLSMKNVVIPQVSLAIVALPEEATNCGITYASCYKCAQPWCYLCGTFIQGMVLLTGHYRSILVRSLCTSWSDTMRLNRLSTFN